MQQQTTTQPASSSQRWERLEAFVREQGQPFIQALLEEEITELLGRSQAARRASVATPTGLRNGYGQPRGLS
jgi:putative transposase